MSDFWQAGGSETAFWEIGPVKSPYRKLTHYAFLLWANKFPRRALVEEFGPSAP